MQRVKGGAKGAGSGLRRPSGTVCRLTVSKGRRIYSASTCAAIPDRWSTSLITASVLAWALYVDHDCVPRGQQEVQGPAGVRDRQQRGRRRRPRHQLLRPQGRHLACGECGDVWRDWVGRWVGGSTCTTGHTAGFGAAPGCVGRHWLPFVKAARAVRKRVTLRAASTRALPTPTRTRTPTQLSSRYLLRRPPFSNLHVRLSVCCSCWASSWRRTRSSAWRASSRLTTWLSSPRAWWTAPRRPCSSRRPSPRTPMRMASTRCDRGHANARTARRTTVTFTCLGCQGGRAAELQQMHE